MKPILCPTDFSDCSKNALEYASMLAMRQERKVIVLHVLHVPTVDMYSPASVLSSVMDAQKASAKNKLEALIEALSDSYDCEYEWQVEFGFATDNIAEQANERDAAFICMGTHGMNNAVERMLGSVSYDTVKKVDKPIIVVPETSSLKEIEHITLAFDADEDLDLDEKKINDALKDYVYNTAWVHVNKDQSKDLSIITEEGSHHRYEIGGEKIVEALADFIELKSSDMLVLKQQQRGFIEDLFHKSIIKEVLKESGVPVMIIN